MYIPLYKAVLIDVHVYMYLYKAILIGERTSAILTGSQGKREASCC